MAGLKGQEPALTAIHAGTLKKKNGLIYKYTGLKTPIVCA